MAEPGVIQLFPMAAARAPAVAREQLRTLEAILFAAAGPLSEDELRQRVPVGADCPALLLELQEEYAERGVNLVRIAGKWTFRTAPDLAHFMTQEVVEQRRLSRAALETLAIIAYHQPVTRAEVENIRGVTLGKGTIDLLMEIGWVRIRGRRRTPGRPVTYGTTETFLEHFGLDQVTDLPGVEELVGAGLLDKTALPGPGSMDELPLGAAVEEDELDPDDDGTDMEADGRE
jgi:segregation and condensation protein B